MLRCRSESGTRRRCLVEGRHGLWRRAALLASELRLLIRADVGLQLRGRSAWAQASE